MPHLHLVAFRSGNGYRMIKNLLTNTSYFDILYITQCDILWRDIYVRRLGEVIRVDAHIKKVYIPMTETGFYILLCLQEESHGYGIVQKVERLTEGEIKLSPGTMYGSLSKMEKDGLIRFVREEEKRKIYIITELGREVLDLEMRRIERLFRNLQEVRL